MGINVNKVSLSAVLALFFANFCYIFLFWLSLLVYYFLNSVNHEEVFTVDDCIALCGFM